MHRPMIGSRWTTPSRRYAGSWRQNPWITATLLRSTPSPHEDNTEDRQQKAAVTAWENEGGSLDAHRSIRR